MVEGDGHGGRKKKRTKKKKKASSHFGEKNFGTEGKIEFHF